MARINEERSAKEGEHRRQTVLAIVEDADEPVHVTELAERLAKQGEAMMGEDEFEDAVDRETISLHHRVLPRLAESGVIDYDREANTVSSKGDRGVDADWLEEDSLGEVLSNLDEPADGSTIGVIDGRRAAIEHGRALASEANEELFCMYVSTDLLEDECIRSARAAIDRGVEVYVGSRNHDVRDLTRRHLPEATIWEPQRGWLDAPVGYPKVGRLVLADRRNVMFAVLDEPSSDDGYPEEKAFVAEGEDNPLVVLVLELLGPRLDHLDYQSTDFRSELRS